MELSDEKILEYLLSDWEKKQRGKRPQAQPPNATEAAAQQPPALKLHNRRCTCGDCYQCRENARWERIFAEKFADPDYYRRRAHPLKSPLSEF